ncbi:hypothetical protein LI205_22440 [bacterium MSK18_59]|nr:hypothetical protein [bacterium MSK18_59]
MRVGNVKEIVFSKDPKQMNWLREEFPYAEVKCPPEFSAEVQNEKDGDVLTTKIVVSYNGAHPYFTNAGSIGVSFPLQDRYTDSVTCRDYRCHAHIFCGENTSYIMALRMGGAAPHLGMVLTKGSLSAYSIERDLKLQSNDRGCFWLHPSAQEFAPGDTMKLEWKVFPHRGREDFREKLRAFPRVILVDAEQYVIYPGETSKVTIEPTFPAEKVTINGASLEKTENSVYEYLFENEKTGEYVLSICADEVKTTCRLLVQERPETLAAKRCAFIVDHQQYHGKIKELQGAYLPYDNEEKILVCTSENDFNAGRERTGMGVLIARALQQNLLKDREKAEQSLREYHAFYLRELVNASTGLVCNCSGKDNSYFRLYNYPWAVTFFLECWKLWGEKEDLKTAVHITEKFYEQDGFRFYPIEMPIVMLCQELEKAGEQEDLKTVKDLFRCHADQLIEIGTAYPASEVNYEQSIVQPAAEVILQVYEVTGEEKYLRGAEQQIAVLELFDGQQPDYHLHETAIRHWDGYWFGKRRVFGDTFPHYWSAENGRTFKRYARLTGNEEYNIRGEHSLRGVLSMFFEDGTATCAYVYPYSVNGQKTDFADPYANDQDWGLCMNLE